MAHISQVRSLYICPSNSSSSKSLTARSQFSFHSFSPLAAFTNPHNHQLQLSWSPNQSLRNLQHLTYQDTSSHTMVWTPSSNPQYPVVRSLSPRSPHLAGVPQGSRLGSSGDGGQGGQQVGSVYHLGEEVGLVRQFGRRVRGGEVASVGQEVAFYWRAGWGGVGRNRLGVLCRGAEIRHSLVLSSGFLLFDNTQEYVIWNCRKKLKSYVKTDNKMKGVKLLTRRSGVCGWIWRVQGRREALSWVWSRDVMTSHGAEFWLQGTVGWQALQETLIRKHNI